MNDAAQRLGLRTACRSPMPAPCIPASPSPTPTRRPTGSLLEAIADWCDRYTPLVGLDPPDGLMLDITGCAHLFGGEAALWPRPPRPPRGAGFPCPRRRRRHRRLRLGASRVMASAAHGAAAADASGAHRRCRRRRCASRRRRSTALAEAGLKRIADLIDLPRAPLAARFGEDLVRRIDQALGREDEPITPRLPVPSYVAEQRFADPIGLERDVLGTIGRLAARARRRDGAARRRRAAAAGRAVPHRRQGLSDRGRRPARRCARPSRIGRLFADRLAAIGDACDPGFGFDMVRLAALVTERSEPVQTALAAGGDHARGRCRAVASHRPPRRPLRAAPRHPPGAAGHAHPGIRRRRPAGGRASDVIWHGVSAPSPRVRERVGVRGARVERFVSLQAEPPAQTRASRPAPGEQARAPTSPRTRGEVSAAASG